jgi:hypothetical protein
MAVTMVIGNRPEIAKSLFAPGYTMASVLANEFSEATGDLNLAALIEIGLALFLSNDRGQRAGPISGLDRHSRPAFEVQCLRGKKAPRCTRFRRSPCGAGSPTMS